MSFCDIIMNTGIFPITKIRGLHILNPGISGLAKLVGILGFGIAIHNGWTDLDDNRQSLKGRMGSGTIHM